MSYYEGHKGQLIPTNKTMDRVVTDMIASSTPTNLKFMSKYNLSIDNNLNELFDDFCTEYIELNDLIYHILNRPMSPKYFIIDDVEYLDNSIGKDNDTFEMTQKSDGILEYFVHFYNAGYDFKEALLEASNILSKS